MLRRNVRLRKEYLYRKGLEGKERAAYERKRLIRKALEGKLEACIRRGTHETPYDALANNMGRVSYVDAV